MIDFFLGDLLDGDGDGVRNGVEGSDVRFDVDVGCEVRDTTERAIEEIGERGEEFKESGFLRGVEVVATIDHVAVVVLVI